MTIIIECKGTLLEWLELPDDCSLKIHTKSPICLGVDGATTQQNKVFIINELKEIK